MDTEQHKAGIHGVPYARWRFAPVSQGVTKLKLTSHAAVTRKARKHRLKITLGMVWKKLIQNQYDR